MARKTMAQVDFYKQLANNVIESLGLNKYIGFHIAYDGPSNKRIVWLNHENTGADDSISCERISTHEAYNVMFTTYQVLNQVSMRMREHANELIDEIPEHKYMRAAAGNREREIMRNLRTVKQGCKEGVYRLVSWDNNACEWYPDERRFIG